MTPTTNLLGNTYQKGRVPFFTFELKGGRKAGAAFIKGLSLFSHLANVGDAKSLVIHPASATHRQLPEAELIEGGLGPGTIRLSIGIEDVEDLSWDLEQVFAHVSEVVAAGSSTRA